MSNLLFKDKKLNWRNIKAQEQNMKKLADALDNSDELRKLLLDGIETTDTITHPDHSSCDNVGVEKRITEKRICRCMYYYNLDHSTAELKSRCEKCKFKLKLRNNSRFEILDYEVPMKNTSKSVGGIDLLIKNKENDFVYGVEIKPYNSTETFVRMIAEILTYSELMSYQVENKGKNYSFKPAICFFKHIISLENSKQDSKKETVQWKNYEKWKDNEYFIKILKSVTVFYITVEGDTFQINELA